MRNPGIEPGPQTWQAYVLPLNQFRIEYDDMYFSYILLVFSMLYTLLM